MLTWPLGGSANGVCDDGQSRPIVANRHNHEVSGAPASWTRRIGQGHMLRISSLHGVTAGTTMRSMVSDTSVSQMCTATSSFFICLISS